MTMDRRDFVRSSLASGAALAGVATAARAADGSPASVPPRDFHLRYAPHFGMFKSHTGEDLVAQLEFMRAEGFTALEDNGMKGRSVADQALIGKTMHVQPNYDHDVEADIQAWFEKYYSIRWRNYPVDLSYLHESCVVPTTYNEFPYD